MLHTTFNKAKQAEACVESYKKLAKHLGGVRTYGADTPIPLDVILESNGIKDAIWALRCTIEDSTAISRLFAVDCAEHVLPIYEAKYPNDKRVRVCIETTRRYLAGKASLAELRTAADTAYYAAKVANAIYAGYAADAAYYAADAAKTSYFATYAKSAYYTASKATSSAAAEREWQTERFLEILRESQACRFPL